MPSGTTLTLIHKQAKFGKIEFTQEHSAVTVGRDIKMIGCGDTAHGRYDNDVGDIGNDITKMALTPDQRDTTDLAFTNLESSP